MKLSLFLLMAAVFAAGCGSTDSSPLEEGGDARADGRMKDRNISEDGRAEARGDSSWKEDGPVDTGGQDIGTDGPVDGGTMDAPDAMNDTGGDIGTDTRMDAPTDTGADADSGGDSPADTGTDIGADSGTDAPTDTGTDTGTDAPTDTGADIGTNTGADAPVDTGTPDTGTETGSDTGTDAGCTISAADAGPGGALNWAKRFGKTGGTQATGVALDSTSGDVVLTGYFTGSTNFGGGVVTAGAGDTGGFVAAFASGGAYKWASVFTGADVTTSSVAVDGAGNVLLVGNFTGSTNFGGGLVSSSATGDNFLAKFNSAGTYQWLKHFGAAPSACCALFRRAAVDSAGNIYLVGEPQGNALDLGCGALPTGMSMFVAKFDSAGSCGWSKAYGPGSDSGSNYTQSETIAFDPTGNVFVAGGFYGTIDFGSGSMTAPGIGMDVFIQKFSPTGKLAWAKSFGSGGSVAQVTGIAADACGNILADGTFSQTIDFGCTTLTESGLTGSGDIFLAKLDTTGNCIWSQSFGDPGTQLGGPLALDGFGGPTITSGFSGTLNFGGGVLNGASAGNASMYIAKFNSSGTYEWAYGGGPPASNALNSSGYGIAASGTAVVSAGTFGDGTLSLGGDSLTAPSGVGDAYLASFVH